MLVTIQSQTVGARKGESLNNFILSLRYSGGEFLEGYVLIQDAHLLCNFIFNYAV